MIFTLQPWRHPFYRKKRDFCLICEKPVIQTITINRHINKPASPMSKLSNHAVKAIESHGESCHFTFPYRKMLPKRGAKRPFPPSLPSISPTPRTLSEKTKCHERTDIRDTLIYHNMNTSLHQSVSANCMIKKDKFILLQIYFFVTLPLRHTQTSRKR